MSPTLRFSVTVALGSALAAQDVPVEFGTITWQRDFAAAEKLAEQQELPLLVLFQEVPG